MTLYQTQQEILKYFRGDEVNQEVLSKKTQDEISVYKSLVLNSMEDLISRFYPHCFKLLENNWRAIIKEYLELYPSRSAVYMMLAQNFPEFLYFAKISTKYTYPSYLVELAIYEWMNIELYNKANKEKTSQLNPIHHILNFKYPITQIITYLNSVEDDIEELRSTDIEEEKEDLMLYRDPETLTVRSLKLSVSTLYIIKQLKRGLSPDQCFENFIKSQHCKTENGIEMSSEQCEQFKSQYQSLITELKNLNILLE